MGLEKIEPCCVPDKEVCICTSGRIIDLLGKKWTLLIIGALGRYAKLRYNEIRNKLGISPKSLADSLDELVKSGLIRREEFNEIPPKVEYSLTEEGVKFLGAIKPILNVAYERRKERT